MEQTPQERIDHDRRDYDADFISWATKIRYYGLRFLGGMQFFFERVGIPILVAGVLAAVALLWQNGNGIQRLEGQQLVQARENRYLQERQSETETILRAFGETQKQIEIAMAELKHTPDNLRNLADLLGRRMDGADKRMNILDVRLEKVAEK